jgi:hypothetical protein
MFFRCFFVNDLIVSWLNYLMPDDSFKEFVFDRLAALPGLRAA